MFLNDFFEKLLLKKFKWQKSCKIIKIIPEFRYVHLNLKLWIFSGYTAGFKIGVSKVQDFGNKWTFTHEIVNFIFQLSECVSSTLQTYLEVADKNALQVLIDFSLTVKAAALIFISGLGSAISSAKEGISGFIYNLVELISFLSCANVGAIHENPNRIYVLNSHLLTLKAQNHKMYLFMSSTKIFQPRRQTVWTQIRLHL